MKMLIEKNTLMEGINAVSRALSTRNIVPVLNGIKFDLTNDGLYLTATDNDITIQYYIDKKDIKNIEETGCLIIYGKSLLEIVRKLPNDDILIENFEMSEVSFKTANAIYNFNCFPIEDFPKINLEEVKNPINVLSNSFKELINKTSFACSLQESRPLLTGVNIKIQGDQFECVATDSYRLAKVTYSLDKISEENINIVIPAKNINEFVKIINDNTDIEMHVFSNKVIFKFDNIIYQTSLLNGKYPNTDNSIAKEFQYILKTNLKDFYNTLDRASLLTSEKDANVYTKEDYKKIEAKEKEKVRRAENTKKILGSKGISEEDLRKRSEAKAKSKRTRRAAPAEEPVEEGQKRLMMHKAKTDVEEVYINGTLFELKVGQIVIFDINGESYSSQILRLKPGYIGIRYRSKKIWVKSNTVKKILK